MATASLYVQLTWEDSETGILQQRLLQPPIAIGRDAAHLPTLVDGQPIAQVALQHRQISRYHALITAANQQLFITDQSANGTHLNGQPIHRDRAPFSSQDTIRIGPYKITAALVQASDLDNTELTHLTESYRPPSGTLKPLAKQTALTWLVGLGILLSMGLGAWATVSYVLQRVRPSAPPASSAVPFEESLPWPVSPTTLIAGAVTGQERSPSGDVV